MYLHSARGAGLDGTLLSDADVQGVHENAVPLAKLVHIFTLSSL